MEQLNIQINIITILTLKCEHFAIISYLYLNSKYHKLAVNGNYGILYITNDLYFHYSMVSPIVQLIN